MIEGYFKESIGGLLGKTVGFYLNDNQLIEGTLLDVKNDHLIVKVNENIFYFPLSQIHALSKNAKDFRIFPQEINYLDKNNLIDILHELKYNWITINCLSNQTFAGLLSRIGEDHIVLVNNSEQLFVQSSFITDIYKGKYESTDSTDQDSNNKEEGNSSEQSDDDSVQLSKEKNLTTTIDNFESNISDKSPKEEKQDPDVDQTNNESTLFNDQIPVNETDNESTSLFNHEITVNQSDNDSTLFDHEITVDQSEKESTLFDYEVIVNQINNESTLSNHTDSVSSQNDNESTLFNLIAPTFMDDERKVSNNTVEDEHEENREDGDEFYIQPSNPNSVHLTNPASYDPQKKARNGKNSKMSAQEYFNKLRGLHRTHHKEEQNSIEENSSSLEKESSQIFSSKPKKVEFVNNEDKMDMDFSGDFLFNSLPRRKRKKRQLDLDKVSSSQNITTNATTFFTPSRKSYPTESTESQNPKHLNENPTTKTIEKQHNTVDSIDHKGLLEKQYFALMKYAEKMYNKLRDERLNSNSK